MSSPVCDFAVEVKVHALFVVSPILHNKEEEVGLGKRCDVVESRLTRSRDVAGDHPTWFYNTNRECQLSRVRTG